MKKLFLVVVMLSAVEASFSQKEKKQFIHKGILRAQATISPGMLLKENASTISIHGNLEYYLADNVSIRGDGFYFLQVNGINHPLHINHSVFAGASYHFKTKNHFDPYFSFAPGIAITQYTDCYDPQITYGDICNDKAYINPLISPAIGFNLYFQRVFHLFAEARYISGKHLSDDSTPLSLNELRFSFGLGWNLNLIKQKK